MNRTKSIDLLRGFIMIAMALDHASAMIARTHFFEDWGGFEAYPSLGWWFTRFISHLCAPGFFFLMGVSMYLLAQNRVKKSWTSTQIRHYFFKRGAFILLLMLLIEFPGWGLSEAFNQSSHDTAPPMPGHYEGGFFMPSTVLFGLGACMMIGGWLWRMGKVGLVAITMACFAFSTWYIPQLSPTDTLNPFLVFLCTPGITVGALAVYPIVPWLGVVTFGMFWAKLFQERKDQIYTISLWMGLTFITTFVALRFLGLGNFQFTAFHDWVSFFTLVKYPPSIAFFLITCGLNLLLLFVFSKLAQFDILKPLRIFGQTAMFFYLVHLYVYACWKRRAQ